ncbi:MAG: DsbA family protein, partial [Hyphococcus sp.]
MANTKVAIGGSLVGAFILGAAFVAYSSAQQETDRPNASEAPLSTSFSAVEEAEIGEIVRAYLMDNPEVIIEAVNAYSERQRVAAESQARENAADHLTALLNPENGFVAGKNPDNARVAVIEMFDYHCGFCKRATDIVQDLVEEDSDIKVIFRELPILREESNYAAEISLAAREQDKFLDLHFALMKASGVLTKERIHDIARKEGLNIAKLEAAAEQQKVADAIIESHAIADEIGVNGTPAFIVAAVDGSYVDVV